MHLIELCAVEFALESGVVSKEHVLNVLRRLTEADAPAPIDTPSGLTLLEEPEANVSLRSFARCRPWLRH